MKSFSVGIILFLVLIIGGGLTLASLDVEVPTTAVTKPITLQTAEQSL